MSPTMTPLKLLFLTAVAGAGAGEGGCTVGPWRGTLSSTVAAGSVPLASLDRSG